MLLESHQDQTSKSWDLVHRLPNRYDLAIGKFHREDLFLKYISGNALERVQRVHEPADFWDITF